MLKVKLCKIKSSVGSVTSKNHKSDLGFNLAVENLILSDNEDLNMKEMILREQLNQYKVLLKELEKKNHILQESLVPYQKNISKLLIENNELQHKLLREKEGFEKDLKKHQRKCNTVKSELTALEIINVHTLEKIKELEKEVFKGKKKLLNLVDDRTVVINADDKTKSLQVEFPVLEISEPLMINREKLKDKLWKSKAQADDLKVFSMVEVMEKHSANLMEELEDLRNDNQCQSEIITALKCQIVQKDREIERLHKVLEGGKSLSVISHDCCSQCRQKDCKIKSLENQLEAAITKQHEAMSRALQLAERNQLLERELKDIDNVALAVEEECQNKVKQNFKNMDILQEKLCKKTEEVKKLEETTAGMRSKIERDGRELDNLRTEKKMLEKNLNLVINEKKNLNDKINHFLLIEKNLTSEISRLQEMNKSLLRQIEDMEERVMNVLGTNHNGMKRGKQKKKGHNLGFLSSSDSTTSSTLKLLREEINDCCHGKSRASLLDKVQRERDLYHNECNRQKDLLGNLHKRSDNVVELMRQLEDREKEIRSLKEEAISLRRENCALFKRFDCGDRLSCTSGDSMKIILDRLEKERDMALSDISRLQGERDALREKIKLTTESQIEEQLRLERIVMENEERIRRLESERREIMSNHTSQRVALANMEEKCDELKEQIRNAHFELAQMTTNYSQLKTLQEQTDRSLSDVQGRLSEVNMELRFATSKIKELEKEKADFENDLSVLKKEKSALKSSLTTMEKEKDGLLIILDEKTEKVAKLENQIKKQENYISELTEKISHMEKKFEFTLNEKTSREHSLRSLERGIEHLKEELQQCERQKEAFARENRRLQDDLASAAKDCLTARRELDCEKHEVENLKRQLQQYVSEVKRAEELLSKKEAERNQMLDHFRSLSLEATALESNNHTLESTVENTKTQLVSANNRIMDLEHQIASKDSLLYNYEKQIAELTTQIAELETKLKEETERRIRVEEDLSALRDLCSAIDNQKEALRRQANSHDTEKSQLMNEVRRLSEEYEGLNQKLSHERSLSQTLEKSLSNSRQETLEHKITNKDLQSHIQHLKQKVDELTQKLESECHDVRRYQAQCAELSQQVSDLRREVTNARFEQAKAAEDSRRNIKKEEPREFCFEDEIGGSSSRNIPRLTFPDDSDRTVSLESEPGFLKFHFEEHGLTFRKFEWELFPLEEGKSRGSGDGVFKEATASEFSSLPDDSENENCAARITTSNVDDRLTEFSSHPTYSVRGRPEFQTDTYVCEKSVGATSESLGCGTEGGPDENYFFSEVEEAAEVVDSCSECQFRRTFERTQKHVMEENVASPEVQWPPSSSEVQNVELPGETYRGPFASC